MHSKRLISCLLALLMLFSLSVFMPLRASAEEEQAAPADAEKTEAADEEQAAPADAEKTEAADEEQAAPADEAETEAADAEAEQTDGRPTRDVVIILDWSGNMTSVKYPKEIDKAKDQVRKICRALEEDEAFHNRCGLIIKDTKTLIHKELMEDPTEISDLVDGIDATGADADIRGALTLAVDELSGSEAQFKWIVLLTAGIDAGSTQELPDLTGIRLYTVGYFTNIDLNPTEKAREFLEELTAENGVFYEHNIGTALPPLPDFEEDARVPWEFYVNDPTVEIEILASTQEEPQAVYRNGAWETGDGIVSDNGVAWRGLKSGLDYQIIVKSGEGADTKDKNRIGLLHAVGEEDDLSGLVIWPLDAKEDGKNALTITDLGGEAAVYSDNFGSESSAGPRQYDREEAEEYRYHVSVSPADGGSVSYRDPYGQTVESEELYVLRGQRVTVQARAAEGYRFEKWVDDGKNIGDEAYSFPVLKDTELTLSMEKLTQEPEETPEPTAAAGMQQSLPRRESSLSTPLLIGIIGLVVVAVGLIAALVAASAHKTKPTVGVAGRENAAGTPVAPLQRTAAAPAPRRSAAPAAGTHKAQVVVTGGPLKGKAFPIGADKAVTLGTGDGCGIVFPKHYRFVSRIHLTLTFDSSQNQYLVTDLSSNGVFTEDKHRLPKGKPVWIPVGTTLFLGDETYTIKLG